MDREPHPVSAHRDFYKGTHFYQPCLRHGYCIWCDDDRQHNKRKTDEHSERDLRDYDTD